MLLLPHTFASTYSHIHTFLTLMYMHTYTHKTRLLSPIYARAWSSETRTWVSCMRPSSYSFLIFFAATCDSCTRILCQGFTSIPDTFYWSLTTVLGGADKAPVSIGGKVPFFCPFGISLPMLVKRESHLALHASPASMHA